MDVRCSQCSGTITVPPDARLLTCTFCQSALVVDPSGVLFNEALRPTVDRDQVPSILRRFLASDLTVSGLDREATPGAPSLEFFPFWAFTFSRGGVESTVLEPAAPSSLQGLQGMRLPPGESRPRSAKITGDAPVVEPEVPLATAQGWLKDRHGATTIERSILYHLPIWRVAYAWRGRTYQAAVDAVSGRVFPAAYPAKAEAPYRAVLVAAIAAFGIAGCAVHDPALKAFLYIAISVPLLAAAWWVIRKQ